MSQDPDDIKRWTARRKAAAVMDIIKGKTTAAELARTHDLTVAEVEQWMDDFISIGTESPRSHPRDAEARHKAEKKDLLARFGTLRSAPLGMLLRHDNGRVFGSRQYRAVITDYGLKQEYITPYTPQQNGLCESFIKTFKEEFCWCNRFQSIEHARLKLRTWIRRNTTIDHTSHSTTSHPTNTTNNNATRQPDEDKRLSNFRGNTTKASSAVRNFLMISSGVCRFLFMGFDGAHAPGLS
jgi:transposase-like protein